MPAAPCRTVDGQNSDRRRGVRGSDDPMKTYALGIEELKKRAAEGDQNAMLDLGEMYIDGNGVAENKPAGAELYRKAAELGNAEAQFGLGECYSFGDGVIEDWVVGARSASKYHGGVVLFGSVADAEPVSSTSTQSVLPLPFFPGVVKACEPLFAKGLPGMSV